MIYGQTGKTVFLTFNGYYLDVHDPSIPPSSGIYCVYACVGNQWWGPAFPRRLLYIGESANVQYRLENHERYFDWERQLSPSEMLCYSVAEVGDFERRWAEAALINHHKPPCNTEYVHYFPYGVTTIHTSGRNRCLDPVFTVYPD